MRLSFVVAVVAAVAAVAACSGEPRPRRPPGDSPTADASPSVVDAVAAAPPPDAAPVVAVATVDARPPAPDDLVDIAIEIPRAVIDMRYAGKDNFTGTVLYPVARCLLRRSVAARLARAEATLEAHGRRLLLWDCYRPASVQRALWELVKDPRYVARPVFAKDGTPVSGSRHSRGAAIDVGLVDLDGKPVTLPTAHDDFTRAAHRKQARKSAGAAELAILESALGAEGLVGLPTEWWHYDATDATSFPLADTPLDATLP